MVIPVSAKGFAEFVLAGPAKKSQIVRNILKPKSKEAQIVVLYYARAIRIIRMYHARNNDKDYLKAQIAAIEQKLEESASPQAKAGLRNNLLAVRAYIELYGHRKRKIVARPRIYYSHGRVRLSASPDLAVEEGGRLRLIKLGVKRKGDNPEMVRIMLRVIYQAADSRLKIDPRDVIYFDVTNAARIRGSEQDADLASTIDSGCESLEAMR